MNNNYGRLFFSQRNASCDSLGIQPHYSPSVGVISTDRCQDNVFFCAAVGYRLFNVQNPVAYGDSAFRLI